LPANVELITLQLLLDSRTLLRLSHSFAVDESALYSQPATVDLAQLFVRPIANISAVTLTANAAQSMANLDGTVVTIYPMEVLTFILTFT